MSEYVAIQRTGIWGAVAWTPAGWRFLATDPADESKLLVYDSAGELLYQQGGIPGGGMLMIRADANPDGLICFVTASQVDQLVVGTITPEGVISSELLGIPAFGQSGVNVRWHDGDFTIYCLISSTQYITRRAGAVSSPMTTQQTSQGWIDVFGGQLRWRDLYREDPADQMLYPTILNQVKLGQSEGNPDAVVGVDPDGQRFNVLPALGQEPTLAVNAAGTEWGWIVRLLGGQVAFGVFPPFGDLAYSPAVDQTTGVITLRSSGTFPVAGAAVEIVQLPIEIWPSYPTGGGRGRLVHPLLGAFDYEAKPDEWVNIDADVIIPPLWASSRTLTSAANVLWPGHIRDGVVEERWKSLGGLAMPITQLRMLIAIWTNPLDPDVGYVQWYPNYITQMGYKVLPVGLSVGGQGVVFDDVVNYLDEKGENIGWVTDPVTLILRIVDRL